jgi:hypothetical protein
METEIKHLQQLLTVSSFGEGLRRDLSPGGGMSFKVLAC